MNRVASTFLSSHPPFNGLSHNQCSRRKFCFLRRNLLHIYIYKYVTDHVNKTNQTKKQEQHRNNTNETPSCIKGPATSSADKVQLPEMSCISLVS